MRRFVRIVTCTSRYHQLPQILPLVQFNALTSPVIDYLDMNARSRVDSWRHSVPSLVEREDPFKNDGFQARCSTRFSFHQDDGPAAPEQAPPSHIFSLRSRMASFRKRPREGRAQSGILPSARPQERCSALGPLTHSLERPTSSAQGPCDKQERPSRPALFKGIFGRKRVRSPSPPLSPTPPPMLMQKPVKLKFLFVGDHASGQTALLYRAAFGHFPDTTAIPKTVYETYTLDKPHLPAQMEL
ncbi:hypothetical protein E4U47_008161 [Claviceps purpurea]|nr:hypothetical protein E4U47_008161 [Claviceps purpurea]